MALVSTVGRKKRCIQLPGIVPLWGNHPSDQLTRKSPKEELVDPPSVIEFAALLTQLKAGTEMKLRRAALGLPSQHHNPLVKG